MITRFTRGFIKTCVDNKVSEPTVLRDWDIIKSHNEGKTIGQIAIKFGLSKKHIHHLINKYEKQ